MKTFAVVALTLKILIFLFALPFRALSLPFRAGRAAADRNGRRVLAQSALVSRG